MMLASRILREVWDRNCREKEERNIVENLERESSNENEYFGTFCP
jgi:hypothetical protein